MVSKHDLKIRGNLGYDSFFFCSKDLWNNFNQFINLPETNQQDAAVEKSPCSGLKIKLYIDEGIFF